MIETRWKALSSALFLCVFTMAPASARHRHDQARPAVKTIRVMGEPETLIQWQARIGQNLSDHLVYPRAIGREMFPQGAVRIAFRCDDDGKPAATKIVQSSGDFVIDRAALRAVNSLDTLHPLPDGIAHDRPMEAWVIYAYDDGSAANLKRGLQRGAELAARSADRTQQTAALAPIVLASR